MYRQQPFRKKHKGRFARDSIRTGYAQLQHYSWVGSHLKLMLVLMRTQPNCGDE